MKLFRKKTVRVPEDLPPVAGGDTRYASLNYIPLQDFAELSRARNAGGGKAE